MRDLRSFIVTCFAALAALAAWASPASAGETLNVQEWLAQPGVRMVAVEFYATWCAPCMEAMPRWKALKEKYGRQGLRIVVVNTQDPDGACRSLPFIPDETVCDLEGHLSDAFQLQGKLPAAFLWSWQGNLLVSKGHIGEVEKAVETYLREAPRVVFEPAADLDAETAAAVRERLTDDGKVVVLAGEAEKAAIDAAKRSQQGARYDEKLACEIGKEVPPNALLKASRVTQGKSSFLNLSLYDLTGGCLLAAASSEWSRDRKATAQDAVQKLLRKLKRADGMQQPAALAAGARAQKGPLPRGDKITNTADRNWKPTTDDPALIIFASSPAGARVEIDGNVLCEKTPCRKMLDPGLRAVRMSMANFVAKEENVRVDGEQQLTWTLDKNTAFVTVNAGFAGAPITIDGDAAGPSPVGVELTAGSHRIEVSDPCFEPARADVGVTRGVAKTVDLKSVQKTAGLRVELSDPDGDPAEGDVKLDGQVVGRTWKTLQVPACGKRVEVQSGGATWRETLSLTAYETKRIEGTLGGARKKRIAEASKVEPETSQELLPAPRWKKGAGAWSLGLGLATVVTGTTLAVLAGSAGDDVKSRQSACASSPWAACPTQGDVDSVSTLSNFANVGIYGGGLLTALGIYWLATAPSDEKTQALELRVGPASVSVGGSF